METFPLRIFQKHALDQCLAVIKAANDINSALKARNNTPVFIAIQNLLNAGANISKLLWGVGGKRADARKRLRESIGISDESPLRKVLMRNNFEHMDERIDKWWADSARHNIADKTIGPPTAIAGLEPIESFRWFDPATKEVIFWGEAFNIQELVTEVERILPKLREEANKPHWDPPAAQ